MMAAITSFLLRHRFLLLASVLTLLLLLHTFNGHWQADFWVHSAAVRELATNPFSPHHPRLLLEAPSAFYSPYALGIAWLSRIAEIGPVAALSIAGIINLLLFLFSLRLFVTLLTGREETAFYTLLFTLLFWGRFPWWWSGFFHLRVLGYVLPYPSTFAASLAFLAFSFCIFLLQSGRRIWLLPLAAVAVILLPTHPLSFIFLFLGLVSLSLGLQRRSGIDYLMLAGIMLFAFILAAAWPYFPFFRLILSESSIHWEGNRVLYVGMVKRIFPALLGLPLLIRRMKGNHRDPLGLIFLGLSLVYIYGGLSGRWGYGRVISFIVFVLHTALADWIAEIEGWIGRRRARPILARLSYSGIVCFVIVAFSGKHMIGPFLGRCRIGCKNTYSDYLFLSGHTGQYEVILSELDTGSPIPTFGGKVVATPKPVAFVADDRERRKAVSSFFNEALSVNERRQIIRKYRASYILLDKGLARGSNLMDEIRLLGSLRAYNDRFDLIRLSPDGEPEGGVSE